MMASKSLTRKNSKIKTEDGKISKTKSTKRSRPKDEEPTTSKKIKLEVDSEDEEVPSVSKKIKIDTDAGPSTFNSKQKLKHFWEDYELLAETHSLSMNVSQNLIKLFDEGNTIPFIARYRKDATGNLTPEQLRGIKEKYDNINALKARSETVLKNIEKSGNLNPSLQTAVLSAHTLEELEYIYAPYKPGTKRGLAERAKAVGLEKPALDLLTNSDFVDPNSYVNPSNKELETVAEVEKGLMHIIASIIATDTRVLSCIRNFWKRCKRASDTQEKFEHETEGRVFNLSVLDAKKTQV